MIQTRFITTLQSSDSVKVMRIRILPVSFVLLQAVSGQSIVAQLQSATATVVYKNQTFSGQPLGWDGKRIALLGRDGRLNFVPADSDRELKIVSDQFQPYSAEQLRSVLLEQHRARYDVSITDHFVVIHPWGDPAIWASPFEDFHNRFVSLLASKGFELEKPKVPMIAHVLRSRNDFDRSLINEVEIHDSRIAGFYSQISNRITTYDPRGQLRQGEDKWLYSAWPIIHEATHQSAFNTGVHNRFAPPPKWLSEGLATMFEAAGFTGSANVAQPSLRVNTIRLKQLRKYLNTASLNAGLINLIANDRLFQTHPELAYSLSWGMSYFLAETRSAVYFNFLIEDGKRPNFVPYTQEARMQDFARAFGKDFDEFERQMTAYFSEQK